MILRRSAIIALALLLTIPTLSAISHDDKSKEGAKSAPVEEITPETQAAINKGLEWLAGRQGKNGAWGGEEYNRAPVAITSIACLAMMAGGNLPGRGRYGDNVQKGLNFILRCAGRTGYINEGAGRGMGGSGMHGHGYATLFLAEIYGTTHDIPGVDTGELKERLKKAIKLIENCQDQNGGWYYEPQKSSHEGSVTVTQIHALRSARNAGIKVDIEVINKAIDYIRKSTNADGTVNYQLGTQQSTYALTAAGVCVMLYLGLHNEPTVEKGLEAIVNYRSGKTGGDHSSESYYYYANFYASLAMFHAGGDRWKQWFPEMRNDLLKRQGSDGAWTGSESQSYGPAFGTAFAALILQIPYRYLPIFQN